MDSGYVWRQKWSVVAVNMVVVSMLDRLGPSAPGLGPSLPALRYFFSGHFYVSVAQPASRGRMVRGTEGSTNFAASLESSLTMTPGRVRTGGNRRWGSLAREWHWASPLDQNGGRTTQMAGVPELQSRQLPTLCSSEEELPAGRLI